MPYFNFSPDLPTEEVHLRIGFDVTAGTPRREVEEKLQYQAVEKAVGQLKLQGYQLNTSGRGYLQGPLDPMDPTDRDMAGSLLHDPTRRERDHYVVILPFRRKAAVLELPPDAEAAVIRQEVMLETVREFAALEVV